ncbi:MAG: hypothetical protein LBG27_05775 [Spirochaetaceae bacterium]|jgi:hypothetical protein|nr:hypothetical protein [Spirochaetaceae bacterium]
MKTRDTAKTNRAGTTPDPSWRAARWTAVFFAVAAFLVSCKSTPSPDTTDDDPVAALSKEQRLEIYARAIKVNGYSPRILDGDIIEFRRDGLYYYVGMEDREPEFVQLVFPAFWEIDSRNEQERAAKAASYASGRSKGAKVYLSNEYETDVSIAVDLYVPNPDDFAVHFPRMLMMIDTGAGHFEDQMTRDWR